MSCRERASSLVEYRQRFDCDGCIGAVTNGAVRELTEIGETGFQVFAGGFAISHAYLRVVGIGGPVEIGGLMIHPGNLIHGDRHGIVIIPHDLAAKLPTAAARISEEAEEVIRRRKNATSHSKSSESRCESCARSRPIAPRRTLQHHPHDQILVGLAPRVSQPRSCIS
jgi:regulator of RNase E activity RraA